MRHVYNSIGIEVHALTTNSEFGFTGWTMSDFVNISDIVTVFGTQNKDVNFFVVTKISELAAVCGDHCSGAVHCNSSDNLKRLPGGGETFAPSPGILF